MKRFLVLSCAALALSTLSVPAFAANTAANGSSASPVDIDVFAIRSAVSNVSISPNGKYLSLFKIQSKDGNPIIEIYEVDDLSKKPRRLNADPMEYTGLSWLSDDIFFASARQKLRKHVRAPEADVYSYKTFTYSMKDDKFTEFQTPDGKGVFEIENLLPKDPDHILVALATSPSSQQSDDPFEQFRPRSYYKFNINDGSKKLIYRGGGKQPQAQFDNSGNPRLSVGGDTSSDEIMIYHRRSLEDSWDEVFKLSAREWEKMNVSFVGNVKGNPNAVLVLARVGDDDKTALWEFDLNTKSFSRKVYGNPEVDVLGTQSQSNFWRGEGKIVAATYLGEKVERHWLDQEEKSLYEKIKPAIKNAFSYTITSRSRDGNTMIVSNSGPHDAGSYYLIKNGKVQKLGSQNPLLKDSDYSDVEYIKYPARDGLMIPAYVTKPKGPGPHPLIVLPHGGPYVPEVVIYDEWSQLLANNGYMVIQPQYRGSLGHGWNHYYSMWDEHGGAMQDDKDDGAKYLIEKGLVDPDRVAMFGWSYGGYAALVAASREPNIYQCVIAGAAVADPLAQYNGRKDDSFKYFDELSAQRGGKSGINPMNEINKVNVPILMVHGDVDHRVMIYHYDRYKKAIKKTGKDFQELKLKGAGHFFSTLFYNHNKDFYTKMLDYLKNDCGPGGL